MGYNKFNLNMILVALEINPNIKEMLELGNQVINNKEFNAKESLGKNYFTSLGLNHTSIDWNGEDGALKIDLTKDVEDGLHNKFEIVTNAGTTEHIRNQYMSFKNLHNMGKVGCIYVNSLPLDTTQNQKLYDRKTNPHGLYEYNTNFFELLCEKCGYEVIDINTNIGTWPDNHFCNSIYKKIDDSEFMDKDEFNEILKNNTKFYSKGSNK